MPIFPSARERFWLLPRNAGSALMLDLLSSWGFRAVCIGFKVGVFERLADGPKSAQELAEATGMQLRGMELLLDSLDALDYVRKRAGKYENRKMMQQWEPLLAGGIPYFEKIVFDDWGHLERQLFDGRGRHAHWSDQDWRIFQDGMVALANMNIREVIRKIKLPAGASHVVDLGAGHGLYSIALCQEHPELKATVVDIQEMADIINKTIAEHGLEGKVEFEAGDIFADTFRNAQLVLIFNVLHSKNEKQIRALFERAYESLDPGGLMVILDQFPERKLGPIGRCFGTLMALSMYSGVGQRTYAVADVRKWIGDLGFARLRFVPIRSAPGNALIFATKVR